MDKKATTVDSKAVFEQKYAEKMSEVIKPTILVCGYTGSGKTSLIQSVCGKDTVPDERIGHGKPMTQEFVQYRNDFINLWDSKGLEPGDRETEFLKNTKSLVSRLQADPDTGKHIHLVWYTIQGPGARVTETDKELIRQVFSNVIAVITKNDITRPIQREAITKELVGCGLAPDNIVPVSEDDHESLRALVHLSMRLLPAAYRDAFRSAQLIDLGSKRVKAQVAIQIAAGSAATAGAIPIPFSDAYIITPIQIGMIASLAVIYGLPVEGVKAAAAPLVAEVAGVVTASSLSKLLPGFGSAIQAAVALAITEVIGQLVDRWMIRCCEARIKGQPMPEFHLPFGTLAQMIRAHTPK